MLGYAKMFWQPAHKSRTRFQERAFGQDRCPDCGHLQSNHVLNRDPADGELLVGCDNCGPSACLRGTVLSCPPA